MGLCPFNNYLVHLGTPGERLSSGGFPVSTEVKTHPFWEEENQINKRTAGGGVRSAEFSGGGGGLPWVAGALLGGAGREPLLGQEGPGLGRVGGSR